MAIDQALLGTFGQSTVQVAPAGFILNLVLAALLGLILRDVYVRYGTSLSNRSLLASNFVLLTVTTMFIITVVKSSLALSLGLIGALSIVRFRTAIKEPEELAYLFLAIAVGLGLGADQRIATVIAFAFIVGIIWVRSLWRKDNRESLMYLTVAGSTGEGKVTVARVADVLAKYCRTVHLKRYEGGNNSLEATFVVEFDRLEQYALLQRALEKLAPDIRLTLIDNSDIF